MKSQLILLLLFSTSICFGQISFPYKNLEPEWSMSSFSPTGSEDIFITLGQDTQICGSIWNPVDYYDIDHNFLERIGYCRTVEKKVYVRKTGDCNEEENLMYDFSANEGDSIYCGVGEGNFIFQTWMVVQNVQTGWFDSVPRKIVGVSYQPDPFFPPIGLMWIEGVGALSHPFYSLGCGLDCDEISYDFNCLRINDSFLFINPFSFEECEITIDTIYVNQNLIGGNQNGVDWENAFSNLQDGLSVVDSGDLILVAQGTYFPTTGNDRTISFVIPNGVTLLGGFIGNETAINQRDFESNLTILSGDIGVLNDNIDNSYHVLYSFGVDSTTLIDGFIIEKGMGDHPAFTNPNSKGGGFYIETDSQRPLANPKVVNCTFRDNFARQGGAICCDGKNGYSALSLLQNCTFENNMASYAGGAIYKKGGNENEVSRLLDCVFVENNAFFYGGGICLSDVLGRHKLENCQFQNNSSNNEGGAIYFESSFGGTEIIIENCELVENISGTGGALSVIYVGLSGEDSLSYIIESSSFINNSSYNSGGGAITLSNTGHKSHLSLSKVNFSGNTCVDGGGAVLIESSYGSHVDFIIENCIFNNNEATNLSGAGAIFYHGFGNGVDDLKNDTRISNSLFYNNVGALAFLSGLKGSVELFVGNCTFYENGEFPIVKNWSADFDYESFFNNITIVNSIIWEFTPIEKLFFNNNFTFTIHDYSVSNSLLNVPDCIFDGIDVCSGEMLFEIDPLFTNSSIDNFTLQSCSPAINAGDNSLVGIDNLFDLEGNARILDDKVDLGPFEKLGFSVSMNQVIDESCEGAYDGEIILVVEGDEPISYHWVMDTLSGNDLTNLSSGGYFITVTDSSGCFDTMAVNLGVFEDLNVFATIQDASSVNSLDGSILIDSITGGHAPYSLLWDSGDSSNLLENISFGTYHLTVTDSTGCQKVIEFIVSATNSIVEHGISPQISITPNPADEFISIKVEHSIPVKKINVGIYNSVGQMLYFNNNESGLSLKQFEIDVSDFLPGIYFLKLSSENFVVFKQVVIN